MKRLEIEDLLMRGRKRKGSRVELFVLPSAGTISRFGTIVPKYGHDIVERNLLKRRLREIGRRRLLTRCDELGLAVDVLARTRKNAYGATFEALLADVTGAMGPEWIRAG